MYLKVENLSYAYDKIMALQNVSFKANLGEITGLIGANGAGKTTSILNMTRFLTPQKGRIFIGGRPISQWKNEEFPVSYISDEPVFYEELTLLEHLHFVKSLYPNNKLDISNLIEFLELAQHINKVPSTLSKGTKQKLMIGLSLLREYQLLIADEPFTGLDPNQIYQLKKLLVEQRNAGKAVLLSTHLLDMIDGLCDRYAILHSGRVLACGTKEELQGAFCIEKNSSLEEIYLYITTQAKEI